MGFVILLGNVQQQSAGGEVYFFNTTGQTSNSAEQWKSIAVDLDGNFYTAGRVFSGNAYYAKYASDGTIEWQRGINTNGGTPNSVRVDSSGNVLASGQSSSDGCNLTKIGNSGTVLYQREFSPVGSFSNVAFGVDVDSNGDIYQAARQGFNQGQVYIFFKASGTDGSLVTAQRSEEIAPDAGVLHAVHVDANQNVYWAGDRFYIRKTDTSLTTQWVRQFGGRVAFRSLRTLSNGDVIAIGDTTEGPGTFAASITKWNSSGTLQWQRLFGGISGSGNQFTGSAGDIRGAVDSEDNVYITTNAGGNLIIAKWNSSGVLQWQREITSSNVVRGKDIEIDSADNVIVVGYEEATINDRLRAFVAKLPNDGSLEGTYVLDNTNFTYQASSRSESAGGRTQNTPSIPIQGLSTGQGSKNFTVTNLTLESITEEIG